MHQKVYSATKSVDRIIKTAYKITNLIVDNEEPSSTQYSEGREAFNDLVNHLENKSPIFRRAQRTRAFQDSSIVTLNGKTFRCIQSYSSQNKSTWQSSTSFSQGALVSATTENGFAYEAQNSGTSGGSEPNFPEFQDAVVLDNDITWKAILSDTPGLGLASSSYWSESDSSSGAVSYESDTKYYRAGDFQLEDDESGIQNASIRHNGQDYHVGILSSSEWNDISDKSKSKGMPEFIYIFYDGSSNATVNLYPEPKLTGADGYILNYTSTLKSYDYDAGDSLDFPDRWNMALTYSLAASVASINGLPRLEVREIRAQANDLLSVAMGKTETSFYRVTPGF